MKRVLILAAVLAVAGAAVAYWLGLLGGAAPSVPLTVTHYDTDADGTIDLTRREIGQMATVWNWDRDGDGQAEVVAYATEETTDGELRRASEVTAWDIGGDGVLDEGDVPRRLQELLRSEAMASSEAAAGEGNLELVGMEVRGFVETLVERYDAWRLSGFQIPIVGAGLPDEDRLLPGAPRTYRSGTHQGFDMYPGHIGAPTAYGGPVLTAKAGTVLRADVEYVELTPAAYEASIAQSRAAGTTPQDVLDLLRGRQIWIDHGHGVVTLYCHLSGVAPGVAEGEHVEAGSIIGFVGNSGTEAATRDSQAGAHLHFEMRIDGRYLGEGMTPPQIRERAAEIFRLQR